MKTYKEFITELNKFEKFLVKQGIKGIKNERCWRTTRYDKVCR